MFKRGAPILAVFVLACQGPWPIKESNESAPIVVGSERLQFGGQAKALGFLGKGDQLMAAGCEGDDDKNGAPCSRGLIRIWNLSDGSSEASLLFPRGITALAVSPDGTKWVAGDTEGRLISSANIYRVPQIPLHHKGEISALAYSPDGKWVASGSLDAFFPLGLMEVKTGGVIKVKVRFDPVSALAFSPDGKTLAIGMTNGTIARWEFASGTPLQINLGHTPSKITAVAFSPDGQLLAFGRQDGKVVILNEGSEQILFELKQAASVTALAFSPDNQYLVVGEENGKAIVLEFGHTREVWSRRHIVPVSDLAYSPNGLAFAIATQQQVFLYHLEGGHEPLGPPRNERMAGDVHSPHRSGSVRLATPYSSSSSEKVRRILQVVHEEYSWLLPLDQLLVSATKAMVAEVPHVFIEHEANEITLRAGRRSLHLDLSGISTKEGSSNVQAAIDLYASAHRFLLAASPRSASILDDAAVEGILSQLGPGVRMVSRATLGESKGKRAPRQMLLSGRVSYLKIGAFEKQTVEHVRKWILQAQQLQGGAAILDLRDSSGGDWKTSVSVASSFVPRGMPVAALVLRKTGDRTEYQSSQSLLDPRLRLVVLVNNGTTGTAEMIACAIRSARAGVVVGQSTAGVDDIYSLFPVAKGEWLRVSTGRFICPDGKSVRWKGSAVDVEMGPSRHGDVRPIGAFGSEASRQLSYIGPSSPDPVISDDPQLRFGIELAVCLSKMKSKPNRQAIGAGFDACQ